MKVLTDREYDEVKSRAPISLKTCPTCLGDGSYKFRDTRFECDCKRQKELFKHYLLANIPPQYQRLDWRDYTYSDEVRRMVDTYLQKFQNFKVNGMGIEFYGKQLGVGKTFAATYVAKELVKLGEKVFFIPFGEVVSAYKKDNQEELEERLRSITILVLDELVAPYTSAQHNFYADKFEDLVRHRTNFNLPSLITTNLSPSKLMEYYPRPYSLLSAKQIRIEMTGPDARQSGIAEENLELAENNERRPIT